MSDSGRSAYSRLHHPRRQNDALPFHEKINKMNLNEFHTEASVHNSSVVEEFVEEESMSMSYSGRVRDESPPPASTGELRFSSIHISHHRKWFKMLLLKLGMKMDHGNQ